MSKAYISVVIPVYMGELFIQELVQRIEQVINKLDAEFEIILVNDHSPDNSQAVIEKICKSNIHVKAVLFCRNFGQHYAIHAGLQLATGDWIVVMDCDLQDRPGEIARLYTKTQEGFDIVLAQRSVRRDSFLKRWSSIAFYKVFGYLTDTVQDKSVANFGIYSKKVIKAILSMQDHIRYFPAMVQWVGFTKIKIEVKHQERAGSESSYTVRKLFSLAFDNIIAFSGKPLKLTIRFGVTISIVAGLIGIYYMYKYFVGDILVMGFASYIISIWFLSGIIISFLGILGLYIGEIFEKVKGRPLYIIKETINLDE